MPARGWARARPSARGIGLAADVALAGLSLGSAAALGAAIGGAASQGFGPLGRRLANALQGRQELSLEDAVLTVVTQRLLALHAALGARGHAANERIDLERGALPAAQLHAVLRALQPARAHAAWADGRLRRDARRRCARCSRRCVRPADDPEDPEGSQGHARSMPGCAASIAPHQISGIRRTIMMELLTDPQVWIALATLTALELVLGIDNIIFISILVDKLPREQRELARRHRPGRWRW